MYGFKLSAIYQRAPLYYFGTLVNRSITKI